MGIMKARRKHGRKRKTVILILILEILILICLWYLLFLPHTPEAMLQQAVRGMDGVDNYIESLNASTEMTLSADDVKGLKEIDEKVLNVPVEISSVANVKAVRDDEADDDGAGGQTHFFSHIEKTIKYLVFEEETEVYREIYTDDSKAVYVLRSDGWHKEKSKAVQVVDPLDLLDIPEAALENASFRATGGQYRIIFDAADIGTSVVTPFVRDAGAISVVSGEVIYGFNKHTKRLESVEGNNIVICSTSAIGTEKQAESESTLDVRIGFSGFGEVTDEMWQIPEDVVKDAKSDKDEKVANSYTLSIGDLESRGETSYSVGSGEDLPAGRYLIKRKSGSGIVKGLLGDNGKESFTYTAGYDYYRIDNMESGKEVKLYEGDKILLSGDGFAVVFEPIED